MTLTADALVIAGAMENDGELSGAATVHALVARIAELEGNQAELTELDCLRARIAELEGEAASAGRAHRAAEMDNATLRARIEELETKARTLDDLLVDGWCMSCGKPIGESYEEARTARTHPQETQE